MTTQYIYPATVQAAVELLNDDSAIAVAGATALSKSPKLKTATLLVDLTRCGLDKIEVAEDRLVLGATLRLADLTVDRLGNSKEAAYIADCAQGVASTQIRNAITVGGNLAYGAPWSDLPIALLALGAEIEIASKEKGTFTVSIDQFCADGPKKTIGNGLITKVIIPISKKNRALKYARFKNTDTEIALIAMGVALTLDGQKIVESRISIGSICPKPVRAGTVEAALNGQKISAEVFEKAAALAKDEIAISPNFRMEASTRARILTVTLRRALETAGEQR